MRSRTTIAAAGASLLAVAALGTAGCGGNGGADVRREQQRIDALSSRIASLESQLSELDKQVPDTSSSSSSSGG